MDSILWLLKVAGVSLIGGVVGSISGLKTVVAKTGSAPSSLTGIAVA
jgi:hypothetical protein